MGKKIVMLMAFFAINFSLLANSPGITLLLHNGKKISFYFVQKPSITINNGSWVVSTEGKPRVSYAYAEVKSLLIEDDVVSSIDKITAIGKPQHVFFNISADLLSVTGLSEKEQIAIYATNGKLVLNKHANTNGSISINLSSLQRGVYIVRTQYGLSYKLFKNKH